MIATIAIAVSILLQVPPTPLISLVGGRIPAGRVLSGVDTVDTPNGVGLQFSGTHSGLCLGDLPQLRLTKSITVSVWIYLTEYTNENNSAPNAQIFFRGDDRSGLDPYQLVVLSNGRIAFAVQNAVNRIQSVDAPIDLHRWTHVLASLNDRTDQMELWIDGALVSTVFTHIRPLSDLDPGSNPGVGIGNVQTPGVHNQPLHGIIADLEVFDSVVLPTQLGIGPRARSHDRQ